MNINFSQEEFDDYLNKYIHHEYSSIPKELLNEREFILKALQATEDSSHHFYFQDYLHLIEDKEVVLAALANKTFTLEHIQTSSLYSDPDVLNQAMNHYAENLQFMPKEWLENREWIKRLLYEDGSYFQYICDLYGDDKEIVLIAADSYPYTLHHMSAQFLNDIDIVIKCVSQLTSLVTFISDDLRHDVEFHSVVIDTMRNYDTIASFSEKIRDHDELMCMAMKKNPLNYAYLSDRLKYNLDYLQVALNEDINMYQKIPHAMSCELSKMIFGKNTVLNIHQQNKDIFKENLAKIYLRKQLLDDLSLGKINSKPKL